jgi:hypothetical protein
MRLVLLTRRADLGRRNHQPRVLYASDCGNIVPARLNHLMCLSSRKLRSHTGQRRITTQRERHFETEPQCNNCSTAEGPPASRRCGDEVRREVSSALSGWSLDSVRALGIWHPKGRRSTVPRSHARKMAGLGELWHRSALVARRKSALLLRPIGICRPRRSGHEPNPPCQRTRFGSQKLRRRISGTSHRMENDY